MTMSSLQTALLTVLLIKLSNGIDEPVVETQLGKLRGFAMTSREGKHFFAFKRIPYAKPPTGELRFQPPKPLQPWTGILDAKEDGPSCIQVSIFNPNHPVEGVEDCLYLSVYTRNLSGHSPVLVHFHGGAHTSGDGKIFGPEYLLDEEIVVVNVNYRVGIFGFLSFENLDMPGNQGMKDQVQSLRWVQENIAHFGGDPNLVTLIGESSGAACVYNHIVSPLSKGLFHRGIAESGSSYNLWNLAPPGYAKGRAEKLMTLVGCPKDSKNAIPCLLKRNASEIAAKFPDFVEWQMDPTITFGPVLEPEGPDAFLVGPVSQWVHNPVPLFMGITSAEGLVRTAGLLMFKTDFKWYSENFQTLAPLTLNYFATASKPDDITPKVRQFYFPNSEISMKDWQNLTTMYSDSWFTVGALDGANQHKGDVFFYYFDYILQGDFLFPIDKKLRFGAFHCSEISLIWKMYVPITPNVETEDEVKLSKKFIKIVTSFMKDGSPTSEESDLNWKKWTAEDNYYVHITEEGFHLKKGLLEDRYKFWKSLNYRDNYEK